MRTDAYTQSAEAPVILGRILAEQVNTSKLFLLYANSGSQNQHS